MWLFWTLLSQERRSLFWNKAARGNEYLKNENSLAPYMVFPRFLLNAGINETTMILYTFLLDRTESNFKIKYLQAGRSVKRDCHTDRRYRRIKIRTFKSHTAKRTNIYWRLYCLCWLMPKETTNQWILEYRLACSLWVYIVFLQSLLKYSNFFSCCILSYQQGTKDLYAFIMALA